MEVLEVNGVGVGVEQAIDHGQTPIALRRLLGGRVRHLRQRWESRGVRSALGLSNTIYTGRSTTGAGSYVSNGGAVPSCTTRTLNLK